MSGLLGRLRRWLGSLTGGGESAAERAPDDHVCAVCGTPVADPEEGCPLCGAREVRPAAEYEAEGADPAAVADDGTEEQARATERDPAPAGASESDDGPTPASGERETGAATDDAVSRLSALRESGRAPDGRASAERPDGDEP